MDRASEWIKTKHRWHELKGVLLLCLSFFIINFFSVGCTSISSGGFQNLNCFEKGPPSPFRYPPMSISLQIEESYYQAPGVHLDEIPKIIREAFNSVGVKSIQDSSKADAKIFINVEGKALGDVYTGNAGKKYYIYTGGEIKGTLTLTTLYRERQGFEFLYRKRPEQLVYGGPRVPREVDFKSYFFGTSFRQKLIGMICDIYGYDPILTNAFVECKQCFSTEWTKELICRGKDALKVVLPYLKNDNYWNRMIAVDILAGIADSNTFDYLFEALHDKSSLGVRIKSMKAMEKIRSPRATATLLAILLDSEGAAKIQELAIDKNNYQGIYRDIRYAAVNALGEIKDPITVPALISVLLDKSNSLDLRRRTVIVLEGFGGEKVAIAFRQIISDETEDPNFRDLSRKSLQYLERIKKTR